MKVKNVMSDNCEFVSPGSNLQEVARKMRDLDCGFMPIGNEENGRLEGVITDRDIVIRAVAEGLNPSECLVQDCSTHRVLYCFEDDDLDSAAMSMREQQVYRLIVLDNPQNKQLRGVISLGDILRHHEAQLAARTAEGIAAGSPPLS
ncbi:CBS domain-containing protein [Marinimicrobium sp. ABcell2]|uniref:CBS domain-containing protein n=1 Tax=Marinimicrobium sp. ABcell2 TaxID=3069751 RepID=UPI0027B4781F|nr:CBS domain-containing protein [Marinimicrobium sp. ABcell2]MDQ2076832.1 CBS domain-containing protein [Marinimicrobium sp. ABcell2]